MRTPHRLLAHPPPVRRHNTPLVLHVTVCARDRIAVLANATAHAALAAAWREATQWLVGTYLIMPDRVHFFCVPGIPDCPPVRRWCGYWKRLTGKCEPALLRVFQTDCFDTQMRSREHYEEKLGYIMANPVRRGLAAAPAEWPFHGKVHDVGWR